MKWLCEWTQHTVNGEWKVWCGIERDGRSWKCERDETEEGERKRRRKGEESETKCECKSRTRRALVKGKIYTTKKTATHNYFSIISIENWNRTKGQNEKKWKWETPNSRSDNAKRERERVSEGIICALRLSFKHICFLMTDTPYRDICVQLHSNNGVNMCAKVVKPLFILRIVQQFNYWYTSFLHFVHFSCSFCHFPSVLCPSRICLHTHTHTL